MAPDGGELARMGADLAYHPGWLEGGTVTLPIVESLTGGQDMDCDFPTYLLKCLQDFLDRHGDELYGELKHLRNALDVVVGSLRFAEKCRAQSHQIAALAQVHRYLRVNAPAPSDPNQMALF